MSRRRSAPVDPSLVSSDRVRSGNPPVGPPLFSIGVISNRTDSAKAWEHWIANDPLFGLAFRVTAVENPVPIVARCQPDGIVLVLTEPAPEAVWLVEELRAAAADATIIVSVHRTSDLATRFYAAGADRLVEPWESKELAVRELRQALVVRQPFREPALAEPVLPPALAEVRRLIGERQTDSEIAVWPHLGLSTVKSYGRQVRAALGVSTPRDIPPQRA